MSKTEPPEPDTYAEQAISIRALAARAKSADTQTQLLHIAVLYEKLSLVLRDSALHSLGRMASTLRRTHQ
ncbi:MAG: hypothetical protein M3O41_10005 [Pseudomonadota bacterium]|nr:hypothetical protein [Pseudomonadota bacterium]